MTEDKLNQVRPLARGTLRLQSDERLLKLFRRGVDPAFDELVQRYRAALVGYAGSIAGTDRAEDVVQESLVKAHRSMKAERDMEPRPWLYTLVRNTALNDVRDNRKHRHGDLTESAGGGSTPDDLAEQRERFAAVLAAVADLPAAQRKALVDHELSGFSHEEIAAELDLSTGATKQLIYRARISLRNAFGAMIPLPLIAWLAEGSSLVATGAAGGGATATGLISGLGGGGAAKLAVVAVVAGGSLAGGIAVEKRGADRTPGRESTARASEPAGTSNAPSATSPEIPVSGSGPTPEVSSGKDPSDGRQSRNGSLSRPAGESEAGNPGEGQEGSGKTGSGPGSGSGSPGGTGEGRHRPEDGSGRPVDSGTRPDPGNHPSGSGDSGSSGSGQGQRPPGGSGGPAGGGLDGGGPGPRGGSGGGQGPGGSGGTGSSGFPGSGSSGSGSSGHSGGSSGSGSSGGSGSGSGHSGGSNGSSGNSGGREEPAPIG